MLKKQILIFLSFVVLFIVPFAGSAQASSKYVASLITTTGATGVEFVFPSFLMDELRPQVALFSYSYGGVIQINPLYIFELNKFMNIGVGLGVSIISANQKTDTVFHLGASYQFALDELRLGIEVHARDTGKETVVKAGWAF